MTVYTFSEAKQNFASLLEKAETEGRVLIRRKDGSIFAIQPVPQRESPLDVQGIDIGLSSDEIVETIREMREKQR